jgi:hypothetical protein
MPHSCIWQFSMLPTFTTITQLTMASVPSISLLAAPYLDIGCEMYMFGEAPSMCWTPSFSRDRNYLSGNLAAIVGCFWVLAKSTQVKSLNF